MREILILAIHLLVTRAMLLRSGGVRDTINPPPDQRAPRGALIE